MWIPMFSGYWSNLSDWPIKNLWQPKVFCSEIIEVVQFAWCKCVSYVFRLAELYCHVYKTRWDIVIPDCLFFLASPWLVHFHSNADNVACPWSATVLICSCSVMCRSTCIFLYQLSYRSNTHCDCGSAIQYHTSSFCVHSNSANNDYIIIVRCLDSASLVGYIFCMFSYSCLFVGFSCTTFAPSNRSRFVSSVTLLFCLTCRNQKSMLDAGWDWWTF